MNYKHNRDLVIKKGIELFWTNGYHSLGVDKICKETGMTKGAFYNSFKSKESFLLTTIESYGLIVIHHIQSKLSSKEKAFDKLVHLYTEMLEVSTQNNHKGCLVNNMMSEMTTTSVSISSLTEIQFDLFVKEIEPTVKKAQDDNELLNSIDSITLTELIHTTFFGFLTRSRSTKTSHSQLMELFIQSLKKQKL